MKQIQILLADDHEMILDGLSVLLRNELDIEIIGKAQNGIEVMEQLHSFKQPDLVVLDINMPQKDGIETATEIKSKYPQVKILILSMHHRSEFIKKLIEIDVDGYILKSSGRNELVTAIRRVAEGRKHFGPEIIKANFAQQLLKVPSHINTLSLREKDVIRLITTGLTSQQIAGVLNISHHTVDSHRKKILSKIGAKNSVDIAKYSIQTGITKGFEIM